MIPRTVRELIEEDVTLSIEGLDRMYINGYVPMLQSIPGTAYYFNKRFGKKVLSPLLMAPITQGFVASIEKFIKEHELDKIQFGHLRKDEITQEYLKKIPDKIGVLYVGVAQEKASSLRTRTEHNKETGQKRATSYKSTVMCNHYYFYIVDEDFGPLFIKVCSYFPCELRICLNGHEYLKRQLKKEGIAYEALDNGVLSCAEPERAQTIMRELNAQTIEALIRKWLQKLPCAFTDEDRALGFDYDLSMLQAEFALTQVFKKPIQGRQFFEQVIRDHLDLGRPEKVSLIFDRRVIRRTHTRSRTRIITHGVIPSLHVDYKHSKIKQYFKEGRALRTETVINNPYDFGIKKRLINFTALREYGLQTNRRLLDVQKLSQKSFDGAEVFMELVNPIVVENQRASALKFGDDKAMMLLLAIAIFALQVEGFTNKMLREKIAELLSVEKSGFSQGRMSYDLRRLRLRDLIVREKGSNRYRVTEKGLQVSLSVSKIYQRLINPTFGKCG